MFIRRERSFACISSNFATNYIERPAVAESMTTADPKKYPLET
jgi:hypothetical protein